MVKIYLQLLDLSCVIQKILIKNNFKYRQLDKVLLPQLSDILQKAYEMDIKKMEYRMPHKNTADWNSSWHL